MKRLGTQNSKVSIILTVYNRESLLERCISSVLAQDYENWELVAVDDGSEDDSLNILLSFSKEDARIKVVHQNNEKLARSRNNGIMFSTGKYVTFLDSDDEYLTSHLSERVQFMEDNPRLGLIHGGVKVIGNQFVRDKDNPHNFIHLSECCIGATFFGKRNVFTSLNGFNDMEYSEDSDFLSRAENNFYVTKVNFKTYIYHRENSDSLTHNYSPALKTAE
jgi:glycosyltransferase involved in cell wall biosynthesis